MSTYRFSFPTTIHFGPGVRKGIGAHLKERGIRRPLIVTDKGLAALPMIGELQSALKSEGLTPEIFSGIWGNPVKSQVMTGVAAYRAHRADALVGIGGGAALDVAKAILVMIHHTGDLFDYEDEKPGARSIDAEIPYWVAIPTTAGTGSEVGRSAVISDDGTHLKKIIFSPRLLAPVVYADPEWTVGLPAGVTAATGMDALTHCVEAFLAKGYHPICDGIALEGVRIAYGALEKAVHSPRDLEARGAMLMASMMGAIAFQKGLGVVHSCAHALGTVADLHHGLANGILIDHALRVNVHAVPERFSTLAEVAGVPTNDRNPDGFLRSLAAMKGRVGIPSHLGAVGVRKDQIPALVDVALQDGCHANNPRPCVRADFEAIFRAAIG